MRALCYKQKIYFFAYFLIVLSFSSCMFFLSFSTEHKEMGGENIPYPAYPKALRKIYVSPSGSADKDGTTQENATSLLSAITHSKPGDHIYLTDGEYKDYFNLSNSGTKENPIVYTKEKNSTALIDGGLNLTGNYTWLVGLEITVTKDNNTPDGKSIVHQSAAGTVLINNIIYSQNSDAQTLGSWDFPDQFIYGNIIYHGWHNIYTQNDGNKSKKWFVDNISMDAYKPVNENDPTKGFRTDYEFHAYGEGGELSGFRLMQNIFANFSVEKQNGTSANVLIGGKNQSPNRDFLIENNFFYNTNLAIGYQRPVQAIVTKNTIVDATLGYTRFWGEGEARFPNQDSIYVTENKFYESSPGINFIELRTAAYQKDSTQAEGYSQKAGTPRLRAKDFWDQNRYSVKGGLQLFADLHAGSDEPIGFIRSFEEWKTETRKAGNAFDIESQLIPYPATPQVFVLPNHYEKGRAHIVVIRFGTNTNVDIDLSGVLNIGESYVISNPKNPNENQTDKYMGRYISLELPEKLNHDSSGDLSSNNDPNNSENIAFNSANDEFAVFLLRLL